MHYVWQFPWAQQTAGLTPQLLRGFQWIQADCCQGYQSKTSPPVAEMPEYLMTGSTCNNNKWYRRKGIWAGICLGILNTEHKKPLKRSGHTPGWGQKTPHQRWHLDGLSTFFSFDTVKVKKPNASVAKVSSYPNIWIHELKSSESQLKLLELHLQTKLLLKLPLSVSASHSAC